MRQLLPCSYSLKTLGLKNNARGRRTGTERDGLQASSRKNRRFLLGRRGWIVLEPVGAGANDAGLGSRLRGRHFLSIDHVKPRLLIIEMATGQERILRDRRALLTRLTTITRRVLPQWQPRVAAGSAASGYALRC